MNSSRTVSPRLLTLISQGLAAWFVLLCFLHWTSGRPLWTDEYNVFLSVRDFSPTQFFTEKLAGGQIFPKLQLFFVQRIAEPFQWSVISLRAFSFGAMLCGFFLWLVIARRECKDPLTYLMFVLAWPASSLFIYYAGELKPYAMDVLSAGLFLFFIMNEQALRQKKNVYLGCLFLLPFLGLLSYIAVLFFIFPLYNLLREDLKDPFVKKAVVLFLVSIGLAVSAIYFFDVRFSRADTSTQGFADHAISFASVGAFFESWWDGNTNLFFRFFAERPRILKVLAVPFGTVAISYMFYVFFESFKKEHFRFRTFRTMALVLYFELLVLGVLKKYPFAVPRTSLFFAPFVFLLICEGVERLRCINRPLFLVFEGAYLLFLIVIAFGLAQVVFSGNLGVGPLLFE